MRLTVKDAVATLLVALAGGFLAWHLAAGDEPFVGSARWTAVVMFVLGIGACATGGRLAQMKAGGYLGVMSAAAAAPLLLMLAVLVTGSDGVLIALAAAIGVMWLVTTLHHLVVPPPVPEEERAEEPAPQPRDLVTR